MLKFTIKTDTKSRQDILVTPMNGKPLLTSPQLNKGTAFTLAERHAFGILGKLPDRVETLEEQTNRVYQQYQAYDSKLEQYIYLNNLHDTNQVLFYSLASQYIREIMPVIYTPTVGQAVKAFSKKFRRSRGLYISYQQQDNIETILDNRSNPEIDIIVVTDGEGVLGIGDHGICAMDIPVAKLMVYTLCGGINPCRTLPITLDVGTNNPDLINDPLYLGLSNPRLGRQAYDEFIEKFVSAIKRKFPDVFLHWEDLGRDNGRRILTHYRDQLCTFNDDIQGTGAVALAGILAGIQYRQQTLANQRIVIFGAGNAGLGIAQEISNALQREGLSEAEAMQRFWLIDRYGLLINDQDLTPEQQPYARTREEVANWQQDDGRVSFSETINRIHPTVLIGCSGQAGAFTEKNIRDLTQYCPEPIILALSNPTELCEATPEQLLTWSNEQALIATGSPFDNVKIHDREYVIPQCNNALVFPGLGLGISAVKATRVSADMIWRATEALSEMAPIHQPNNATGLLPPLDQAQAVAKHVAYAVAKQAILEGHAKPVDDLRQLIEDKFWIPRYLPFERE